MALDNVESSFESQRWYNMVKWPLACSYFLMVLLYFTFLWPQSQMGLALKWDKDESQEGTKSINDKRSPIHPAYSQSTLGSLPPKLKFSSEWSSVGWGEKGAQNVHGWMEAMTSNCLTLPLPTNVSFPRQTNSGPAFVFHQAHYDEILVNMPLHLQSTWVEDPYIYRLSITPLKYVNMP